MRRLLAATLLAASALTVVGCSSQLLDPIVTNASASAISKQASSVVRIDLTDGGHGSGVYIGNGIILTAGHVAKDQKVVMVKMDNGTVQSADVLWVNADYDVAALAPVHPDQMMASYLSCGTPKIGDSIVAAGSPGNENDLYIPGKIAGAEHGNPVWKSIVVSSVPAGHGISGGGVFDDAGEVIGILVGGSLDYTVDPVEGKPMDMTSTGLSYIVPGSAICKLIGRA